MDSSNVDIMLLYKVSIFLIFFEILLGCIFDLFGITNSIKIQSIWGPKINQKSTILGAKNAPKSIILGRPQKDCSQSTPPFGTSTSPSPPRERMCSRPWPKQKRKENKGFPQFPRFSGTHFARQPFRNQQ